MSLFGWRLTNKKPQVESDLVQDLHNKLESEQRHRKEESIKAENKEIELKILLSKSEAEQNERQKKQAEKGKTQAVAHLKAAERYEEQMNQSEGARHSELKAIVDKRIEQASNLGFPVNKSISQTINNLL